MKKIILINSYSDNNKGDLGIILGTINTIKKIDSKIKISAISSFSKNDPYFKTEHEELKKYVINILPTLVGRVHNRFWLFKFINVFHALFFDFFVLKSPSVFFKYYMGYFYPILFKEILDSDMVISKGGSFLCNKNNIIDKLRLQRELIIFKICLKLKKPVNILGQSLGPVYGNFSRYNLRSVLFKLDKIILREDKCKFIYPNIFYGLKNVVIGNDFAFGLNFELKKIHKINYDKPILVGLTLKNYNDVAKNTLYFSVLKKIIIHLNTNFDCRFHFIPHVTIDDDFNQCLKFKRELSDDILEKCEFDFSNYMVDQLLNLYFSKDIIIGTRLHSTIFSLVTNTRVINLGYHGTKAKGVFEKCGLKDYQFEIDDKIEKITNSISKLLSSDFDFSNTLKNIRSQNEKIVKNIIYYD